MVRVSPHLHRPDHFALYAERIENSIGSDQRVVFAAPPQHGKTETTIHGLCRLMLKHPDRRFAYLTYSQHRANSVSRKVRIIMAAAGVVVSGTLNQMLLPGGGQCLFSSIDAGIMGEPVDGLVVVDDPYKNRSQSDSARRREVVEETYREGVATRVHPGASIFVLATRWHPQDLSGVLVKEGSEYINLPAIAEADDPNGREVGEALFPKFWPLEALERKRREVLEFSWAALYQGRPRPKGGKVFHEPTFYTKLPEEFRRALGVDLAYTAKTSADWSICVHLLREERYGELPRFFVFWVDRAQVEAPSFALTLKGRHAKYREAPMLWRASGTEKGAAQFIQNSGIPLQVLQPPGDKLVSAHEVAAAWNDGRVLVPDTEHFPDAEEWIHAFLDTLANFTGHGNEIDDDVDALGNAHAALDGGSGDAIIINRRN